MIQIGVYGAGCKKCKKLHANVLEAVQGCRDRYDVQYITDMEQIVSAGILSTPALVVDGEKKISGQVVSVNTIRELLGIAENS